MFTHLFSKRLLFVSGKGGTGKSLVSALLALLASRLGKRVLLVEAHLFDKMSPLFGHRPVGHQETQIADRISCINLNGERCFEEYVTLHLGMPKLYERVFSHNLVKSFLEAIPGLDETMMLGRLFHTCELKSNEMYDLVIFDCPASGHFLKLLTTPDAIMKSGLMGPLIREVTRVSAFLNDPRKCGSVIVTLPEDLVLNETIEFLPQFEGQTPVECSAVVLNKTFRGEELSNLEAPLQKIYNDKISRTASAIRELSAFLSQNSLCKTLYCVPDEEVIREPLTWKTVEAMLPLIERRNLDNFV